MISYKVKRDVLSGLFFVSFLGTVLSSGFTTKEAARRWIELDKQSHGI